MPHLEQGLGTRTGAVLTEGCCHPSAGHKHEKAPKHLAMLVCCSQPLRQDKPPLHAESLLTDKYRYKKCRDAITPFRSWVSGSSEAAGRISPPSLAPGSPADRTSLAEEGMISLRRNFLYGRHWKMLWEEMGAQCLATTSCSREPCP